MMMPGLIGVLFLLLIYGGMIAVAVFLLILLSRFVSAHERVASSLDIIARKIRDEAKP
jgi:hypothetical protein